MEGDIRGGLQLYNRNRKSSSTQAIALAQSPGASRHPRLETERML